MNGQKQPLHQHISELQKRLMTVVSGVVVGSSIGFLFREQLQAFLIAPLGEKLYYTSPAGGFNFIFQLVVYFGLLCAFPLCAYNIIRFLQPAIPNISRKKVWTLTFLSMFLGLLGASFAYFFSLPAALHFLSNFADKSLESIITTNDYLSFLGIYILGFMLIFQIPLFIYIINNITPLPPSKLVGGLRPVVVASVVLSAIITPTTDPINLAIMAVPMIILYMLAIIVVWFVNRRQPKTIENVPIMTPVLSKDPEIILERTRLTNPIIPQRQLYRQPYPQRRHMDIIMPQRSTPQRLLPES